MTSLLLANLLGPQPQPSSQGTENGKGHAPVDAGVQPVQESKASQDTGSTSTNTDGRAGAGSGTSAQTQLLSDRARQRMPERPPDATAGSVVAARASALDEEAARRIALAAQARAQDEALVDRVGEPFRAIRIGEPGEKPNMPDPLPTSPILKRMREDA